MVRGKIKGLSWFRPNYNRSLFRKVVQYLISRIKRSWLATEAGKPFQAFMKIMTLKRAQDCGGTKTQYGWSAIRERGKGWETRPHSRGGGDRVWGIFRNCEVMDALKRFIWMSKATWPNIYIYEMIQMVTCSPAWKGWGGAAWGREQIGDDHTEAVRQGGVNNN